MNIKLLVFLLISPLLYAQIDLETSIFKLNEYNDQLTIKQAIVKEAEGDFNVALAQKITSLKIEGTPVTLCEKLAKGDTVVAGMLLKFKIAEGVYDAAKKKIQSLVINIDSYRSLLSWAKSELERA